MISLKKIPNFNSRFEVVSCFIEYQQNILLLLRQENKPQPLSWGVPAGKVEGNDSLLETITREVKEETGIVIPSSNFNYFKKLYVMYTDYDFIYHIYSSELKIRPIVKINPLEHKDFLWTSPKKALALPLIPDEDFCINLFYGL